MLPSVMNVLAALHSAGEQGLTSGDIAEIYDPTRDHATINAVNNVLYRYRDNGRVRRSDEMEHLSCTTRTKVWRWYITPAGSAYYLQGGLAGQAAARRAEKETAGAAARRRREIFYQAITDGYGKHTPHEERRRVIASLYAQGLNKSKISSIFGITRERVRQIVDGMNITQAQQDHLVRLLLDHPEGLSTTQIKASGIDFPGVMHISDGVLKEACHYLADAGVIEAHWISGQGARGVRLFYTAPEDNQGSNRVYSPPDDPVPA